MNFDDLQGERKYSATQAFGASKAANLLFSYALARRLQESDVTVNAMCPGWVRTDMGGPGAPSSVAEGADTAVRLATLPDGGPSGGFFRDRKPIPW